MAASPVEREIVFESDGAPLADCGYALRGLWRLTQNMDVRREVRAVGEQPPVLRVMLHVPDKDVHLPSPARSVRGNTNFIGMTTRCG
jgi:hypothetical protein